MHAHRPSLACEAAGTRGFVGGAIGGQEQTALVCWRVSALWGPALCRIHVVGVFRSLRFQGSHGTAQARSVAQRRWAPLVDSQERFVPELVRELMCPELYAPPHGQPLPLRRLLVPASTPISLRSLRDAHWVI